MMSIEIVLKDKNVANTFQMQKIVENNYQTEF